MLRVSAAIVIVISQGILLATARTHPPVKLFILAGDANVEGFASVPHLHQLASTDPTGVYASIWNNSHWSIRGDVFVSYDHYRKDEWLHGPLTVGKFGNNVNRFGPEVPIGNILGDINEEPVVIIKAGWRGRSLAVDFASPSFNNTSPGFQWHRMMTLIDRTANNLHEILGPAYKYTRPEIGGLIWWHGYSDYANFKYAAKYADNLAAFVRDLRSQLKQPFLPVVIAELGGQGTDTYDVNEIKFRQYQKDAVAMLLPYTTKFVQTTNFVKSTGNPEPTEDDNYKLYQENAATMMDIGQALALELVSMDFSKKGTPDWRQDGMDIVSSRYENYTELFMIFKVIGILLVGFGVFMCVLKCSGSSQTVCNNRLVNTVRARGVTEKDELGDLEMDDNSPSSSMEFD